MSQQHKTPYLNLLRLLAFGAVGTYLYYTHKNEGSIGSALGSGRLSVDTDKLVDSVMPWINLPPAQREIIREGAKSFASQVKTKLEKKES